jgi:23S rRNA U2552 (ribose-2'-O)-methylase RlmE/FtsJ
LFFFKQKKNKNQILKDYLGEEEEEIYLFLKKPFVTFKIFPFKYSRKNVILQTFLMTNVKNHCFFPYVFETMIF